MLDIDQYNQLREDGLRYIRDKRLGEMLTGLSDKLKKDEVMIGVARNLVSDWGIVQKLRIAQRRITERKPEETLAIIAECGKALNAEWLKPDLREAYAFISSSMKTKQNGWRNKARRMLENFARFLGQRNPRYAIVELRKTRDDYMDDAIKQMEHGNRAIRKAITGNVNLWLEKKLLRYAADKYREAARALETNCHTVQ